MLHYNRVGDFARVPTGPFTTENKKKVWDDLIAPVSSDADPTGKHFSIVDDTRFPGGRACRMTYPKGSYGMKDQFYQIRYKSPQTYANLEFYWLFEDHFSFYTPNTQNHGGGKIGPCINWGEVGGVTEKRGTRAMWWINANGSVHAHPVYSPSCQDQRTGNQLIQPPQYTKPILTDHLYKFGIKIKGGPNGHAEYRQDDVLIAQTTHNMQASVTDDVIYDFAFFMGGDAPEYGPEHDSYARHGGVHFWSSDT